MPQHSLLHIIRINFPIFDDDPKGASKTIPVSLWDDSVYTIEIVLTIKNVRHLNICQGINHILKSDSAIHE